MQKCVQQTQNHRNKRAAFSLVELMIVIVIIGILMAIILPAIGGAQLRARETAVLAELKNLEKAIQEFKLKFGVEPPSRIFLYENEAGWDETDAVTRRSKAFIRQAWPNFDFDYTAAGGEIDIDGDGSTSTTGADDTPIDLRGAECLVFFLGGVCATEDASDPPVPIVNANGGVGTAATPAKWFPLGFSTNPQTPFARGGSRIGPFYEFQSGRMTNVNTSTTARTMPEYLDSMPSQQTPIVYLSSNGGRGYDDTGVDVALGGSVGSLTDIYWANTAMDVAHNPNSFQLISPGTDAQLGTGGYVDLDDGVTPPARAVERDNITNFSGGILGPR